jgi:hypothetical protein
MTRKTSQPPGDSNLLALPAQLQHLVEKRILSDRRRRRGQGGSGAHPASSAQPAPRERRKVVRRRTDRKKGVRG